MVKLCTKYLIRRNKANKWFLVRKKGDKDKQFLNRITRLPLQNQFIDSILKMEHCINVEYLYLQNNLLRCLENMGNFPNLTHLYLQRNFISQIDGLILLKKLQKIYLGYNEIQVLEGMQYLKEIREVHIESQDLAAGETLYFEPLTVHNLGTTLQVLNISENYLTSIGGIKHLISLKVLIAKNNCLHDIEDITDTISELLDNKEIHSNTRAFIEGLVEQKRILFVKQKNKELGGSKKEKKKVLKFADDVKSEGRCIDFEAGFPTLVPIYQHPVWKLRTNVNSVNPNTFLPRPYWKKGGLQKTISIISNENNEERNQSINHLPDPIILSESSL